MSADIVLQSSHAFQPSYSRDRHFYWFCPCMTIRYGEKGSLWGLINMLCRCVKILTGRTAIQSLKFRILKILAGRAAMQAEVGRPPGDHQNPRGQAGREEVERALASFFDNL